MLRPPGLNISDPLPGAGGLSWAIDAAGSSAGWSVTGSPPTQQLVYTPTTLAAGAETHAHVVSPTTWATCASTLGNTATYTSTNAGNASASAAVSVHSTLAAGASENFDGVTAPALPLGWTATNVRGTTLWTTSSVGTPGPAADSAPNPAFVDDPAAVSDKRLDSPPITFPAPGAAAGPSQLTFRHNPDRHATPASVRAA